MISKWLKKVLFSLFCRYLYLFNTKSYTSMLEAIVLKSSKNNNIALIFALLA
jgi:hypothetical protein